MLVLVVSGLDKRWIWDGGRAGCWRRGDISSTSIVIVTVGGARVEGVSSAGMTWGEGGWDVGSCEGFAISLRGDLTPDDDRSSISCSFSLFSREIWINYRKN